VSSHAEDGSVQFQKVIEFGYKLARMNRRQYLGLVGAGLVTATAGCANALTGPPGDSSELDLPDDATVYAMRDNAKHDSVRVNVWRIRTRNKVEYNNPEEGTIKTWNPGDSRMLVIADIDAENLSNEEKTFPRWRSFKLSTPEETVKPVVETPDGTSVEEIESPQVVWPESNGISPNYKRGWSAVYDAPRADVSDVAVKWVAPDGDTIFWRSEA